MPHKFNTSRRHKFAKKKYRVTNWCGYNESLRNRGDLTVWITGDARKQAVLHQSPDKRGVPLPVKMVSQLTQTWHSQVRSFC